MNCCQKTYYCARVHKFKIKYPSKMQHNILIYYYLVLFKILPNYLRHSNFKFTGTKKMKSINQIGMKQDRAEDQFKDGYSQPIQRPNEGRKAQDDNQSNRFIPKGLHGQHPAIGMQLDLDIAVERDAYGQPLSPTHLIATNKPFAGARSGGGAPDGNQINSSSGQHNFSSLVAQGHGNYPQSQADEGLGASLRPGGHDRAGANVGGGNGGSAEGASVKQAHDDNLQTSLLGPPKHSGLSTFEYAVDSQLRYYCAEMKSENVDRATMEKYQRIFHGDTGFGRVDSNSNSQADSGKLDDWKTSTAGGSSINRKNIQIETDKHIFSLAENDALNRGQKAIHPQFPVNKGHHVGAPDHSNGKGAAAGFVPPSHQKEETLEQLLNAHFKTQQDQKVRKYLMEIQINLPLQTLVEQVEVKFGQAAERYDLFKKYLRIAGLTRSSVLRRDALERDSQITQDIQMTCLSPEAKKGDEEAEKKRLRAQKFFKIQSGFLDTQKTTAEFNLSGAVCNQLNLLFEFDYGLVQDLIAKCKQIQADRIGQNLNEQEAMQGRASKGTGKHHLLSNTVGRGKDQQQDAPDSQRGLREQLKISNTNSQFMSSSYGDEMFHNIGDGSEMDDLDNEVQVISKRQKNMRQGMLEDADKNLADVGKMKSTGSNNIVAPDEIRIIIDDDKGDHIGLHNDSPQRMRKPSRAAEGLNQSMSGTGLQQQLQEKGEAQKLTKTAKAANSHGFFNYSDEEKKLLDERKLFEGTSHAAWAQKLLTLVLQAVKITGFNMSKIPAITNLAHLMNTAFYLKKDKIHLEDALEVDFMLGTLMISSKRNTQAIELLRNKVQAPYLRQIEHNIAKVQGKSGLPAQGLAGQNEQSSSLGAEFNEFQNSILSNDCKQNLKVQIKKLFTRCAIIELMCSESMCAKPQLSDKLQALFRMTQLCRGQLAQPLTFGKQIFLADDEYTTMTKILPYMLKFTIQCIENNYHCSREIVIISALRNIQFILETQGCSLDSAMIVILKSIFKNYPDKVKQEKILKRQREIRAKLQHQASQNDQGLITIQGAGSTNLNGGHGLTSHPKTLLSESKRVGGIQGTSSANELNLRGSQRPGLNSTKEMQQLVGYQFNQNSARGSQNATDHLRLDESRHLQNELNKIFRLDKMTMIESIFSLSWIPIRDEPVMKKEPNSGFEKTLMNLFNTLLESYISVLSSISSHILHQIFYEVIVPCLTGQPFEEDKLRHESMDKDERQMLGEFTLEVKIFAVKIAEKIITICQGDLIMSRPLLDTLVKATSAQSYKKQLEMTGTGEQYRSQMKNLWASIRSKVFTNYSMKGFKQLIEWLVAKMSMLAQNCNILDGKSSASEIAMLELSDDNLQQLSQYLEIITFISVGRRNSQEEANSLIKIKHEYCMDLYLLLNPLLFWLDFSVEREERLNLFKHVYQTIKDVLENLPPKKVDIDILQIIVPILERTSDYLRQSSPTQSMLKFLDIVLQDIIDGKYCQGGYPTNLQYFFLDQLTSIVGYISYSLYEEIFPVFDKLLQLCGDVMTEDTLRRCIIALVDKYTMKCKGHKHTVSQFMKSLLDSNSAPVASTDAAGLGSRRARNAGGQPDHPEAANFGGEFMDIFDQEIDIVENPDRHAQGRRGHAASQRDSAGRSQATGRRAKKNSFYEVMLEQCFFDNDDSVAKVAANVLLKDRTKGQQADDSCIRRDDTAQFRSPQDLHEIFVGKLQFFIDSLSLLGDRHINQFNALISNKKFKSTLFNLLNVGETNIRLKCHEILEIVGTYFIQVCSSKSIYQVALPPGAERASGTNRGRLQDRGQSQSGVDTELMEVDLISHDRLYIAQLIIQCVRKSFERTNGEDSYLQFNSLILLDYLFQNILPVANFQNEQIKQRQNTENQRMHNQQLSNAVAGQGRGAMSQNQDRHGADAGSDGNQQMDDSHLEDGSSGGEGTGGQNSRQARMRNENAQARQRLVEERIPNANYLGELDDALDVETLNITSNTPELEVTDPRYTAMRLKLVFKLWPYVQEALNSPWSNIRSICYGLICSMLKIDIRDCQKFLPHQHLAQVRMGEERRGLSGDAVKFTDEERNQILMTDLLDKQQMESNKFYLKLRQSVIPMMINLLSSKESESKAGGLNILGSICGLSYDFSKIKITRNLEFFKRNSEFISLPIWQHVFELQDDWDITIKEASIVLIQLCAPREAIKYFNKCKIEKENQKFQLMLNKMARNGGAQGGHGSLSNLSSARQNSLYNHINSKGSLNGLRRPQNETGTGGVAGDSSNRRIDYKNVDFGYKDKHIPHIPGLINEFGKIDIATFLNDNQDMMHLNVEEENTFEPTGLGSGGLGSNVTGSSQPGQKSLGAGLQKGHSGSGQIREHTDSNQQLSGDPDHILGGNKQLALDLGKIYETKDDQQKRTNVLDAEAAFHQSSVSQASNSFGQNYQQSQLNQQILQQSLQQNQNLVQAMQGQNPGASQSSLHLHQQFDFFVDAYSDDQIQEIISIFRNDFKPPKNLWIEKAAESTIFSGPDFFQDIYSSAIEQFNQQQMLLQQKQQQDLQEQVSNGSSLSGAMAQDGAKLSAGDNMLLDVGPSVPSSAAQAQRRGEFSPPPQKESASQQDNAAPGQSKGAQGANKAQQQILQNLHVDDEDSGADPRARDAASAAAADRRQDEQAQAPGDRPKEKDVGQTKNSAPPPSSSSSNANSVPASPELSAGAAAAGDDAAGPGGQGGSESFQKFDPSRDLNIFEQINFDDMNINQEDINSCNFKQDVINSSASDIGENLDADQHNPQQQAADQRADGRGRSAESGENGSAAWSGPDGGAGASEGKMVDMEMDSEAQLDIDDGHIEILPSLHDLQQPADGGLLDPGQEEPGAQGDIMAAHELDLDLRLPDMHHGVDAPLFHQKALLDAQKQATESKASQSQDDTPAQRGYGESESNVTAEKLGLHDDSEPSSPGDSPGPEQPELYHKISQLATELPIIESRSNEVSSSAVSGSAADREASHRSLQGLQPKTTAQHIGQLPRGASDEGAASGRAGSAERNGIRTSASNTAKNSQPNMVRPSEASEEVDLPGVGHPPLRLSESGERPYGDIRECGFDGNGVNDDSELRGSPDDEDAAQERWLAHLEQQNGLTRQLIKQDQKRAVNGQPPAISKQSVSESQHVSWIPYGGANQTPGSQPESHRSKQAASKGRQGHPQGPSVKTLQGQASKGVNLGAPGMAFKEAMTGSGQGLEDYEGPTNLHLEDAGLIHFKQKMQARTQPIDVNELRGLEQDVMMLANEYNADQHPQYNNGSQASAPQKAGMMSKGASANQKAGQGGPDQSANHKLLKPASTSNSSPDIKSQLYKIATAKQSQQRKSKEKLKGKKQNITTKYQSEIDSARQNFVQAHIPIAAPAPMSLGNFSHRVQPSAGGPGPSSQNTGTSGPKQAGLGLLNQQNSAPGTKKQILKNLRHIKTNNEDYIIMQNISSQMNGKLTDSLYNPLQVNAMNLTTGLNTTKNNKIDKSFENLISAFALRSGPAKSGQGTSLGCIKTNTHASGKQHSHDSSQGLVPTKNQGGKSKIARPAGLAQSGNTDPINRNLSAASGKQKTLSSSPKRQSNNYEIKKLLNNATGTMGSLQLGAIAKTNTKQSKLGQGHKGAGGQAKPKSAKTGGGAGAGLSGAGQGMITNPQSQQMNNKRQQEQLKDLNYFIKTIEKFSKKNAAAAEKGPQYASLLKGPELEQARLGRPSQPQVITGMDSGSYGGKNGAGLQGPSTGAGKAMRSRGSNGSDPQTPKDVLINLGDQMLSIKQGRSQSNQNSGMSNGRKANSKNKMSTLLGQALGGAQSVTLKNQGASQKSKSSTFGALDPQQTQQLYEQMKNQQQLQVSKATAKNIQQALRKNGLNLSQLNMILSQASQGQAPLGGDLTGAPGSGAPGQQYTSIRNKNSLLNQFNSNKVGSSGSRSRGRSGQRGVIELTPDSNANGQGNRHAFKNNGVSKSSKSNKSQQQNGSYSPPHSSNQLFENLALGKHLLGKNLNINTNMQAQINNLVSSHRDAGSVDSKGRSCSTNKSGRGSNNLKAKNHKKKKLSFNLNQPPPQLNNLMSMNYSQTQKLDMKEINRQLMQISNPRGAGSTQNKAQKYDGILLSNNRGYGHHLNSQRERRDRSAGSNNSKSRAPAGSYKAAGQARQSDGDQGTTYHSKFASKNPHGGDRAETGAKYQSLLLSEKF